MREEEFSRLQAKVRELRHRETIVNGERIPDSVLFLERQLIETKDESTRIALYGLICSECAVSNLYKRRLAALRAEAAEFSDEPVPFVSLAIQLSREQQTQEEARQVFEMALRKATRTDRFVRYALGERARFARMTGDLDLLQDCLTQLIADVGNERSEDCGFEADFVSGLEHNPAVWPLADRYLKAIGKSATR